MTDEEIEELQQRVEKLENAVQRILQELERLVKMTDELNKNQMSSLYKRLVEQDRLEEMREKHPEMVEDLEETAEEFIAPKIEDMEDNEGKN